MPQSSDLGSLILVPQYTNQWALFGQMDTQNQCGKHSELQWPVKCHKMVEQSCHMHRICFLSSSQVGEASCTSSLATHIRNRSAWRHAGIVSSTNSRGCSRHSPTGFSCRRTWSKFPEGPFLLAHTRLQLCFSISQGCKPPQAPGDRETQKEELTS